MNNFSNDISGEKKYNKMDINSEDNEKIKLSVSKKNSFEQLLVNNSVRVLTYNFFSRPPPVNTNGTDYKNERLKDFIDYLPDFDIICFQEVFTTLNDRKHRIIREGAKFGLKYYVSAKPPSFFSKYVSDSGLLILSRYEIVENDLYDYFLNVSGDCVSNKGILYAKIKINNRYLFLFNTHLQSTYFDESQSNINTTIQIRTGQTEELINFVYNKLLVIPRNEIENGCILIVGDFNIDAHDNKFVRERYIIPKYKISEYELLKKKFSKLGKAIDLMEKKYNCHLYTFGNNDKPEYDQVLTNKAEVNLKQTLDYMWELIPDYNLHIYENGYNSINKNTFNYIKNKNENYEEDDDKLKILYDSLKVQEFLMKNRPYQQLSDHFGISVDLSLPSLDQNINEGSSYSIDIKNI